MASGSTKRGVLNSTVICAWVHACSSKAWVQAGMQQQGMGAGRQAHMAERGRKRGRACTAELGVHAWEGMHGRACPPMPGAGRWVPRRGEAALICMVPCVSCFGCSGSSCVMPRRHMHAGVPNRCTGWCAAWWRHQFGGVREGIACMESSHELRRARQLRAAHLIVVTVRDASVQEDAAQQAGERGWQHCASPRPSRSRGLAAARSN